MSEIICWHFFKNRKCLGLLLNQFAKTVFWCTCYELEKGSTYKPEIGPEYPISDKLVMLDWLICT